MDDDKFGVCGLIWLISMALFVYIFRELGVNIWLSVVLSVIVSLGMSLGIYIKWTK